MTDESLPGPDFPRLHIRPRYGWLNDPNGVCQVDGRYHVFFQYNPHEPVHANVHWGHVSSPDLLTWTEHPVALTPRPGTADAAGCWSGCVTDDDGVPTAVYTGVPDHAANAGVLLARSDRTLEVWQVRPEPVAGTPADAGVSEVRDPFVFRHDGHRYAVQGAGSRDGSPKLLLWNCDDLEDWVPLDALLTPDDPVAAVVAPANIWECPSLAQVDGRWVLVVSLWRWVDETHKLAGVRYLLGDLEHAGPGLRFVAESGGLLDAGAAFYAPQLLPLEQRTLLWGWSWEVGRSEAQVREAGWAGVLTFPRELYVRDGVLGCRPAAELEGLRRARLVPQPDRPLEEGSFELLVIGPARLRLIDPAAGPDPAVATLDVGGSAAAPTTVLVDGSLVEVFRDGQTRTERAYPTSTSRWWLDAAAADITAWVLGR